MESIVGDAVTVAKRDLKAGEDLDGLGGFTCYALLENHSTSRAMRALPMGVSEGCRLKCDVPKDRVVTYDDIDLPPARPCDALLAEQDAHFGGGEGEREGERGKRHHEQEHEAGTVEGVESVALKERRHDARETGDSNRDLRDRQQLLKMFQLPSS